MTWTDSTEMTKPLLLVGAGGYAKEVAQIARRIDPKGARWDRILYVAVSRAEIGTDLPFGRVEYCDEDILSAGLTADVILAVGEPAFESAPRRALYEGPDAQLSQPDRPFSRLRSDADHDGDRQCHPSQRHDDLECRDG